MKTSYELRIRDWISDVCSSDLMSSTSGVVLISDIGRSSSPAPEPTLMAMVSGSYLLTTYRPKIDLNRDDGVQPNRCTPMSRQARGDAVAAETGALTEATGAFPAVTDTGRTAPPDIM